ncbi:MAG: oligosaccharide repeat unit polymerase [Pseudomonadales bacterium]|nr:oligosaccharide repeat unit polymerase [Pseudomonadales bacterium]
MLMHNVSMLQRLSLIGVAVGAIFIAVYPFGIFYETALASLLLIVVLCVPIFSRQLKWYEPVCAMNAMLALLASAGVYFAYTGFTTAEHAIHSFPELAQRAPLTLVYISIWMLCFYVGYYLLRTVPFSVSKVGPIIPKLKGRQSKLALAISLICFVFAMINVGYNIWLFNPDSPLSFFTSFGVSKYREKINEGVYTTLGYHLFIVSLIFFRYSFQRWTLFRLSVLSIILLASLVSILSRGQIFFTFSVLLFFFSLEYFFSENRDRYFKWAIRILPLIFVCIVFSYFARLVSVEVFLAERDGYNIDVVQAFLNKLTGFGALILGKGNVPNLPAMLVYEDHFGHVEDFLHGRSIFSWSAAFLPFFEATYIGYGISEAWYPNNVGGIPPGVIHEAVANFGGWGALLFAFLFGAISVLIFNSVSNRPSFILVIIYMALLVRFWFILPKVEFAVLSNAIWLFLPTAFIYAVFFVLAKTLYPESFD